MGKGIILNWSSVYILSSKPMKPRSLEVEEYQSVCRRPSLDPEKTSSPGLGWWAADTGICHYTEDEAGVA